MSTFEARLQRREEVAHATMAFHFEKPAGFRFKPGQAIDVVMPGAPSLDTGSNRHAFSIVSAAFLVELQQLARENRELRLIVTMTQMEKSRAPWDGETGPIDGRLVRRIVGKLSAPICYLAGPPGMVESMRETLGAAGVNDDDIRCEAFYGY